MWKKQKRWKMYKRVCGKFNLAIYLNFGVCNFTQNAVKKNLFHKVFGQSRFKFQSAVSVRMPKEKFAGVQAETLEFAPAVFVVANNRMTDVSAMES